MPLSARAMTASFLEQQCAEKEMEGSFQWEADTHPLVESLVRVRTKSGQVKLVVWGCGLFATIVGIGATVRAQFDSGEDAPQRAVQLAVVEKTGHAQTQKDPRPWTCHHYAADQGDLWCQTAGTRDQVEYNWVGTESNLCGECWCCRRDAAVYLPEKEKALGDAAWAREEDEAWRPMDRKTPATLAPPLARSPSSGDGGKEKTEEDAHRVDYSNCTGPGEDCQQTQCCLQEGFTCYQKNEFYGGCKSTCSDEDWDCKALGTQTPVNNTSPLGALAAEPCAHNGRCRQPGYRCYEKDDYYSMCKVTCNDKGWSCKALGERTPLATSGGTRCAWGANECAPIGCCAAEGLQCYERDEFWSSCLSSCEKSMNFGSDVETWSCKEYGVRRKIELGCTWMNEECSVTKLCCQSGMNCIQKDEKRAYCTTESKPAGWNGTTLGYSRSDWKVKAVPVGARSEGGTTLFCFMAVSGALEESLMQLSRRKQVGIFACDGHDVISSWPMGEDHVIVDVMVKVWEMIVEEQRYKDYDWTIKVDPGTVFLPSRLRRHMMELHAPSGWPMYLKGKEEDDGVAEGACAVFSKAAIDKLSSYYHECYAAADRSAQEPAFMRECMKMVGAGYMVLKDLVSPDPESCLSSEYVTFAQPARDTTAWQICYAEAKSD